MESVDFGTSRIPQNQCDLVKERRLGSFPCDVLLGCPGSTASEEGEQ